MKVLIGNILELADGKATEFEVGEKGLFVRFIDNDGNRIIDFRQADNGTSIDVNSLYPLLVVPKASNHIEIEMITPVGAFTKLQRKRKRVKI